MIKQKGYNVFPDEVESHIVALDGVDTAEVVGVPHRIFDEGIFAFVRPKKGATVTVEQVRGHCKKIASYKRPQHAEIWPADKEFPITRSTKVDKLALQETARAVVEDLRRKGEWDAS
jgi:acyl-CoA synthetase (AMP-forming)/AMP-acid ligase II